jgi:hypothetical protein
VNVELIRKAIEHLKQEEVKLGRRLIYDSVTGLCCGVGEMDRVAGNDPSDKIGDDRYVRVAKEYGLTMDNIVTIFSANDETHESMRNYAVAQVLESFLENPTPNNVPITSNPANG